MEFSIVARDKKTEKKVLALVKERGHSVSKKPEIVISIGGDGTFLLAERKYPGVPKLHVRKNSICHRCAVSFEDLENALIAIAQKKYETAPLILLEARSGNRNLVGLNEIQIHNDLPIQAIRFSVSVNGSVLEQYVVADGLVIATPFGSTAYYYSIGGEPFDEGIGIGFNNPHARLKSRVVPEDAAIQVTLLRGPATVYADNLTRGIPIKENQEFLIRKSNKQTSMIRLI